MKSTKKILISIFILILCLTTIEIITSFGLFETNKTGTKQLDIAKWNIYVNNYNLNGNNNTFTVDTITYTNNEGVTTGKFAPGVTGQFILVIDPRDTEVAFRYNLSIDLSSSQYSQIQIDRIEGIEGTNLTVTNNVYSRIVSLNDITNHRKDKIKVTFSWANDGTTDESDSTLGQEGGTFEIPITISFNQYTGE